MPDQPSPSLPTETYLAYAGSVDQSLLERFFAACNAAYASNVQHLHFLLQSTGGGVGDGICLYNYLRALTLDLTIYNTGTVASIATIAFLGAKKRKTSAHASFMLHRTQTTVQYANTNTVKALLDSSIRNDQITESILREHLTMPAEKWTQLDHNDLFFTAKESVKHGFAQEIGEFSPPTGTRIWTL
jgi:ATP-dependent Clp protease protease subunit